MTAPGSLPRLTRGLTRTRQIAGLALAAALTPLLTWAATAQPGLDLAAAVPLYLFVVVLTSLVGGFRPAIFAAAASGLLLNYYLVPPTHTLSIRKTADIVAIVTFLLVAVLVSRVVDRAARRQAEADTLAAFAAGLLGGEHALAALLDRVRATFAVPAVSLLERRAADGTWSIVAATAPTAPRVPDEAGDTAMVGADLMLALRGRMLSRGDRRVLAAIAPHVGAARREQQLAAAARAAEPLAESDRQRTALLAAVGHDLRTPIAAAKAAVSSLRSPEVPWRADERAELLRTAEDALDRLTDLVTNLLDISRLQAGALPVVPGPVGLDDVVARALDHADPSSAVDVDVPPDLPEVLADAGLLERVVANVVQNAVRYAPPGSRVRVAGRAHGGRVELRIIDSGPGIPAAAAEAVFRPFQRTDDSPAAGAGVGLGLAIARGFTEAMGGDVSAERTPGGGATVVIGLTVAGPA